jgi:hypothetical protein
LALADTWAFAVQMEAFFAKAPAKAVRQPAAGRARHGAGAGARSGRAAVRRLDARELASYRKLVGDYAASERLSDRLRSRAHRPAVARSGGARDAAAPTRRRLVGACRCLDRLDLYGQRIPDELRWRAELALRRTGFQGADVSQTLKRSRRNSRN